MIRICALAGTIVCIATLLGAQQDPTPRQLAQVDLAGASFQGIDMRRANLAGVVLVGARLTDANVAGVNFWRARLDDVDLRGVKEMTAQQLASALWDPDHPPHLDSELRAFSAFWQERRVPGRDLQDANWWGADLSSFDFTGCNLRNAVLIHADLRGATLQRCDLTGAILVGADLSGADLRGAVGLTASQLVSAKFDARRPPVVSRELQVVLKAWAKRRLAQFELPEADLWLADLAKANLSGARLSGSALMGANLRGAVLRDAVVDGVVWTGADISGADLRGAKGLDAAGLFSAIWEADAPPVLDDAMNLQRVLFDKKRLQGRDLAGANLWGRDLAGADLVGTSLRDVVFIDANLRGANLRDADLTGSNLTRADISGADLRNVTGLGVGQVLSARWAADDPPDLGRDIDVFRRLWAAGNLAGRDLSGACLWDVDLNDARLQGANLRDVVFVRGRLRGADLSRAELRGARILGSDISGTDLRGVRNLARDLVFSAVWDRAVPPVFDQQFHVLRKFAENKRLEFDLVDASMQAPDPPGTMGPARAGDRVASFRPAVPPRLGMTDLIKLLRKRHVAQIRVFR